MRTIGSLFSGVGGLERGLEMAGLGEVVWQVEVDPFARSVLARHWPSVNRSVVDVKKVSLATLHRVDVICGGFPCTDVSGAGLGAGLDGARSGLWWEYARIVREFKPEAVVVENVSSGLKRWLCPVRRALRELGYRTRALEIPALAVGAPHRRARVFILGKRETMADGDGERLEGLAQVDGKG